MDFNAWRGFKGVYWKDKVNVRDFIQNNYTQYVDNDDFLCGISDKTNKLWTKCTELLELEAQRNGVLSIDPNTISKIDSYEPGYIDKANEVIFGLQTDEPLKRGVNPFGGIRMAKDACTSYGYTLSPEIEEIFTEHKKTHNDGVFDAYTDEIRIARRYGIITGLPDAYGRGRIIGDYRRVALYGIDFLIEKKKQNLAKTFSSVINEHSIKLREEINEQIWAMKDLLSMASKYGFDISRPAENAKEAIQWLYFAYLAAIKEQNGAAMSLGRTSTFIDIYISRDIENGLITEWEAQELIDHFIIKLRLARQLRTPEYNELFAGDPLWVTEAIGGIGRDGKSLVSKTSFRYLQSLYNLGPAPEPNMTILWSEKLPENFKKFCTKVSADTSAIQYENDDLMRPLHGDDYGIACCVSAMTIGKQMQYFGARCNLAKTLLLALNGGRDEISGALIVPDIPFIESDSLNYFEVLLNFKKVQDWVVKIYVDAMNIIHFMHDKYAYEKILMALHDSNVERLMAFGIAGLSVVADSLSAIRYAKVTAIRNDNGLTCDFKIDGCYPAYGNDDSKADDIAVSLVTDFKKALDSHPLYRGAKHTLSILTITSNVVYGKKTGATPDGRKGGEPFAPGANPMPGRDNNGTLAWLNSIAKIPYETCRDGISCTLNMVPGSLGTTKEIRVENLSNLIDGYFGKSGHHLNINMISRETLLDAIDHPEKYPQLTIRVSGYAVHFNKLTLEQKREVISRSFHERM